MIYVYNDHGRLIGIAFTEAITEPKAERTFFDEKGRLIACVYG